MQSFALMQHWNFLISPPSSLGIMAMDNDDKQITFS